MTEKSFLMASGFLGAIGTLLPWVKGPFGDNITGITTMQGMLVLVVFFIILGLTLVVKPTNKQVALNFLIIALSVVAVFITGYTILRVMFDIGPGPALSPIFSIEKGLVLSFVGSLVTLGLSLCQPGLKSILRKEDLNE